MGLSRSSASVLCSKLSALAASPYQIVCRVTIYKDEPKGGRAPGMI